MYSRAVTALSPDQTTLVSGQVTAWETGACPRWRRVSANIQAETALTFDLFCQLLEKFAGELSAGVDAPEECWRNACRSNQFNGRRLPDPIPECLGRATPISNYAILISESPGVTKSDTECEKLIRKIDMKGPAAHPRELRILRRARLGRYVVWATFNEADSSRNPFDVLPRTREEVRTALGLGDCSETDKLVLLSYRSMGSWGSLELFRPTIAEADQYCWYSPVADSSADYGMTRPLDPNPSALLPQPEVVHREITGEALLFPLYLVD